MENCRQTVVAAMYVYPKFVAFLALALHTRMPTNWNESFNDFSDFYR